MRWLFNPLYKLWEALAFAEKVALVVSGVGFIVIALSMAFSAVAYRSDKEAYLYELQMLRTRSTAMQFMAAVNAAQKNAQQIAEGGNLPEASKLGLARLPEKDEVFVVSSAKIKELKTDKTILSYFTASSSIVFRSITGALLAANLVVPSIPVEDGSVFVLTSEGFLVGSSDKQILADTTKTFSRLSVRIALKSNLTESTTSFDNGKQHLVISHMEIPSTNLLALAEVPTDRLMAPFYNAMRLWLAFGFVIILIGAAISFFAVKKVAEPAILATKYLVRIAQGDFTTRTSYGGKDEFKAIFNGIDYLTENIALREDRLKLVGEGLTAILTQTANFDTQLNFSEFAHGCASVMQSIIKKYRPLAFGVEMGGQVAFFNAISLEVLTESVGIREREHALEIPVVSHTNEILVKLSIFGVRPTSIWPETMQTIAQMSEAIVSYFERRSAAIIRSEKMRQETELSIAGIIQKSLVTFPEATPNVDIAQHYTAAEQVGGDWSSAYFDSTTNTLSFFMGDATGHGIAPSLVTAVVAGATRQFQNTVMHSNLNNANREQDLLENLAVQLNSIVLDVGAGKIGMTMIMGSLKCDSGELTILNLGHTKPILFGADSANASVEPLLTTNDPLGDSQFSPPHSQKLNLSSGQGIMFYTDGLIENYDGRLKRKMLQKIAHTANNSSEVIELTMARYVELAGDEQKPVDDVAVLAVRWTGGHIPQVVLSPLLHVKD